MFSFRNFKRLQINYNQRERDRQFYLLVSVVLLVFSLSERTTKCGFYFVLSTLIPWRTLAQNLQIYGFVFEFATLS